MDYKNFYLFATKTKFKGRVNAFAITCQCYLETGNWTSELSKNANNYAGIKKTPDWKGKYYDVDSPEYINGVKYIKRSQFRKYDNAEEFIEDYITSKISMSRYSDVRKYGLDNFYCYFYYIWEGGWATDPSYVKKLVDVSFKLGPILVNQTTWIQQSLNAWNTAKERIYKINKDVEKYIDDKFKSLETTPIPTVKVDKPKEEPKVVVESKSKKIVIIDPGHGGKDPGATNSTTKEMEKTVTLAVALKMKPILQAMGYEVHLTRETDIYMDTTEKGSFANKFDSSLCLSVHCNSTTKKDVYGHEDFYYAYKNKEGKLFFSEEGKKIAECINKSYMEAFPKSKNRKVKGDNFALVRIPKCPAALTELEFISNDDSCKMLNDSSEQQKMAQALCNGIKNYLN